MSEPDARTALIDTAVAELGAAAPTLGARTIARKAGVNHGLVPYYFKNAEGLLVAAVEEATTRYLATFKALLSEVVADAEVDRSGCQGAIVSWALDVVRNDPEHFTRRRTIVALARGDAVIARCARTLADAEIRLTGEFVAALRGRAFGIEVDIRTARLIVALFDGLAAQASIGVAPDDEAVAEAVTHLIQA